MKPPVGFPQLNGLLMPFRRAPTIHDIDMHDSIEYALTSVLTSHQQLVIRLYFGLYYIGEEWYSPIGIDQIAKYLNCGTAKVKLSLQKALKSLRDNSDLGLDSSTMSSPIPYTRPPKKKDRFYKPAGLDMMPRLLRLPSPSRGPVYRTI